MGCQQSTPVRPPTAVGQTERFRSRAVGLETSDKKKPQQLEEEPPEPPKLNENGQLTPEEIARRTSFSPFTTNLVLGNKARDGHVIRLQYARWTQRGYYPDDPHKRNQDDLGVTTKFAGENHDAFFAVYDGHGATGHECASFAKKKLPQVLAKYLRQERVKKYQKELKAKGITKGAWDPSKWPLLSKEEYENCCRKAFMDCNDMMHKEDKVLDKFSGTTAVAASFHGGRLTVCNAGDSRIVLGHQVNSSSDSSTSAADDYEEEKVEITACEGFETPLQAADCKCTFTKPLLAIPLSRDHTPFRKDERERVRKAGAEVMSIDQMEGKEEMHDNWGDMVLGEDVDLHGDPPRVWVKGQDYPGCAFTRSLGDGAADEIGVIAEPEMLTCELNKNDKVLVIASDGIFEFLSNQQVMDICVECLTPLEACEKLVRAAYDSWLVHEKRTDDISVIVCFLNTDREPPNDIKGSSEELVPLAKMMYGCKPIGGKKRGEYDTLSVTTGGSQKEEDLELGQQVKFHLSSEPARAPADCSNPDEEKKSDVS